MPSLLSRLAGRFPAHTGPYSVGTVDIELPVSSLPHTFHTPCPDPEITTISFRLFYPCLEPDASSRTTPASWIPTPQDGHIKEFGKFMGLSESMSNALVHFPHLLNHIKLAAYSNARPLHTGTASDSKWPLVIFSHGLAGNRTTYSHICSSMASHGLVVAAPEHRDGSCPVSYISPTSTDANQPRRKLYRRITHTPSEAVYRARDDQLRVRLWELGLLVEALTKIDDGSASANLRGPKETPEDALSWFRGLIDVRTPGKVTFAGHSFGAATTLQLVKNAYWSTHTHPVLPISRTTSNISDNKKEQIHLFKPKVDAAISKIVTTSTPTILLDMWTLPLRSPFTSDLAALPMPHFSPESTNGGAPILAVMSSAFAGWKDNLESLKSALSDPYTSCYSGTPLKHPGLTSLLVQSDAASATDSGYESETASAQSVAAPSSPEPPVVRPRAKAHIFYPLRSAHLSQSDYGVLFPTFTRYFAKGAEPDRTIRLNVRAIVELLRRANVPVQGLKGKPNSDPAILSTQADSLRGWVFVDVDENTPAPTALVAKRGSDSVMDKVVDQVAPGELQNVAEYGGKS